MTQVLQPIPSIEETELIIQPRSGWIAVDWAEMLHYRELLYFLVWRDVKVRYKQTVLGASWAIIQPVFNMVIFTVIFGQIAGFGKDLPATLPFSIWMLAGLLPWTLISSGITLGGISLINQQNLLTKIYFPRLFVPTATIGGAIVDMFIASIVLAGMMIWFHAPLSWQIIFVPILILFTTITAAGFAYLLSALTVSYRDFKHLVPFMAQVMQYLSFVMIPLTRLRPSWQWILSINPAFGIIDAYRSAIFGMPWHPINLTISCVMAVGICFFGIYFFRRMEKRFADVL